VTDEELRHKLAKLIVNALGIGTGKQEHSVIREIFEKLDAPVPARSRGAMRIAEDLEKAAPTADALINVVVAVGGRFIDMVNEVYMRLAQHAATIGGDHAPKKFRFERGGINEQRLTISAAFIEQCRQLKQVMQRRETGYIREGAIHSFLLWDDDFYGQWPLEGPGGERLAAWVLALNPQVRALPGPDEEAALTLVTAAERLVGAHITRLETVAGPDPLTDGNGLGSLRADLARFTETGVVGMTIFPNMVTRVGERSTIGFNAEYQPVVVPDAEENYSYPTPMGELAAFAAMWRLGLRPVSYQEPRPDRDLPADPGERDTWLRRYRESCEEAARWLTHDVFTSAGYIDEARLIEVFREFLNLPLWRHRELLYEIWVLCATLTAAEQAGWTVTLEGLSQQNDECHGVDTAPV
jgi:hypothetical protein